MKKNKLKKDNLLTIDKLYFALSFLLIAVAFLVIVFSKGKAFNNLFWHGSTLGYYPDLFESVIHARTRNPYKLDAIYPAFAYCLIYFFNFFIPGSYKNNFGDLQNICDQSETFVIAHLFYTMITLAFAYFIIKSFGKTEYKGKYALILIFLTSSPYIFLIERGNTVIITILFLFVYIFGYNSENKVIRELALICLACAAAMKLYPALFGLLLLSDKKYKEAVRAVIYGVVLFVVPFFFMGGLGQIPQMLKNSLTLNNNTMSGSTGFGYGFKVNVTSALGSVFDWLFAKNYSMYIKMGVYFVVPLLLLGSLFIKKNWKRVAAISLVVILMPDFSFIYNVIYLLIPLILFIKDVRGKKITFWNTIYMLCFVGAFAPLPYGDIFRSVGGYNNMNFGTMVSSMSLIVLALLLTGEGMHKMFKNSKKIIVCGTLVIAIVFGAVPYVLADKSEPVIQTVESVWQLTDNEKAQVGELYNYVKENVGEDDDVLCFPKVDSLSDFDNLDNHLWYSSIEAKDTVVAERTFKKLMPKYVVVDLSNYSNYMLLLKNEKLDDSDYDSLMTMQSQVVSFLNKKKYEVVKYVKTENNRYIAVWENSKYIENESNFWNDGGKGTKTEPYIISSAESLVKFSDVTNCGRTFENKFISITEDIDMSGVKQFTPISRFDSVGIFKGFLDGKGHTISHLTLKYSMTSKNTDASNIAFVNNLYGTIANLKIENSLYEGYNAATFVRTSNVGVASIINCMSSNNTIKAANRAGAIGDKFGAVIVNTVSDNDKVEGKKNSGFIGLKDTVADTRNCYSTTGDIRNYATLVDSSYINSQTMVDSLNAYMDTYRDYQIACNKKLKKKKKVKIVEYSKWTLKDGKLTFVK